VKILPITKTIWPNRNKLSLVPGQLRALLNIWDQAMPLIHPPIIRYHSKLSLNMIMMKFTSLIVILILILTVRLISPKFVLLIIKTKLGGHLCVKLSPEMIVT
jgi:hypothetical protein